LAFQLRCKLSMRRVARPILPSRRSVGDGSLCRRFRAQFISSVIWPAASLVDSLHGRPVVLLRPWNKKKSVFIE
jgi:hypothetical protein